MRRAALTVAILATTLAVPALAGSISKSVKSGKTVKIASYGNWKNNCRWVDVPRITVTSKPAHGKVTKSKAQFTIPSGPCKGIPIPGMSVSYRAKPGYRGKDRFAFRVSSGPASGRHTVAVSVR